MKKLILSVDYDGTIVADGSFPEMGKPRMGAVHYLRKLYDEGHTILIWTCREGKAAENARILLDNEGIRYHGFNTNCPHRVAQYDGVDCRKQSADVYLDDKSLLGIPEWPQIYRIIQQMSQPV